MRIAAVKEMMIWLIIIYK